MKRTICMLIVLCVMLSLVPTTVFAAQSYGIFVGSTEVTSANYQNITGPGISGKVSYDPYSNRLILDNATITSYYDTSTDGTGDVVGIISALDTLEIHLIGQNTIAPDLSGKNITHCSALGNFGDIKLHSGGGSLVAKAYGATDTNAAILAYENIYNYGATIYAEAGPASKSSIGIYATYVQTEGDSAASGSITAISGNVSDGDSFGILAEESCNIECPVIAKSGVGINSIGINCGQSANFGSNVTVSAGAATEGDSIGLTANSVYLERNNVTISSGKSEKGSSLGIHSTDQISIYAASSNIASGPATSASCISTAIYAESTINIGENCVVTVYAADGDSSIGIFADRFLNVHGKNLMCKSGNAVNGDSLGVVCPGITSIAPGTMHIQAGNSANGISIGMLCSTINVEVLSYELPTSRKYTIIGNDASISGNLEIENDLYWAGNAENTKPVRNVQAQAETPLTDAEQYKYLYIVSEDQLLPTPFDDVAKDAYYVNPVLWAVDNGITTGIDALTFAPDNTCTRAQTVTFLWRFNGCPEPEITDTPFTDLEDGAYYYKAVLWAVEEGITNGMTPTTFQPNGTVTRSQVVTFLWRNAGTPDPKSTENDFADVNADSFYATPVQWAVENNITTGMTSTSFAPDNGCTRGQIVTFLYRAAGEPAVN